VVDKRVGRSDDARARRLRAQRKIDVLPGDRPLVEAADSLEQPSLVENVRRLRELAGWIHVQRSHVKRGPDRLQVHGIRADGALHDRAGVRTRALDEPVEPVLAGTAVVIGEGDQRPAGRPPAEIALQ
jgi:hypothetical protein